MGPDLMQSHDLERVRPIDPQSDGYGNQVAAELDRLAFSGWIQQDSRSEGRPDGRTPTRQTWLLVTKLDDLMAGDRVEWAAHPDGDPITFEVEGPPEPVYRGRRWHHTEATLRLVEG